MERAQNRIGPRAPRRSAFTLIELLVVIAIMAILMAAVVPLTTALNDRARVGECEAHLQQVGVALKMYFEDHHRYPETLQALYDGRYLDQRALLRCERGERDYFYQPPGKDAPREAVVAACCDPAAPAGQRPHSHGDAAVVLLLNGQTRVDQAQGAPTAAKDRQE